MSHPTFDDLVSLEPRLADLLEEAQAYRRGGSRSSTLHAVWYGYWGYAPGFKRRLSELVGWSSGRTGILGSSEAYEMVYKTLYQALTGPRTVGDNRPGRKPKRNRPSRARRTGDEEFVLIRASDLPEDDDPNMPGKVV
jgi:hypothetical protein